MWFSTVKGAVWVQPKEPDVNSLPPSVLIEEVQVDGSHNWDLGGADQPDGQAHAGEGQPERLVRSSKETPMACCTQGSCEGHHQALGPGSLAPRSWDSIKVLAAATQVLFTVIRGPDGRPEAHPVNVERFAGALLELSPIGGSRGPQKSGAETSRCRRALKDRRFPHCIWLSR